MTSNPRDRGLSIASPAPSPRRPRCFDGRPQALPTGPRGTPKRTAVVVPRRGRPSRRPRGVIPSREEVSRRRRGLLSLPEGVVRRPRGFIGRPREFISPPEGVLSPTIPERIGTLRPRRGHRTTSSSPPGESGSRLRRACFKLSTPAGTLATPRRRERRARGRGGTVR